MPNETELSLKRHEAWQAWVEQNAVTRVNGSWTATSYTGLFTVTRQRFKAVVGAAMELERVVKEKQL